jgi:hypothetical protein
MGIYIAAAITTALAIGLYGYIIAKMSSRADWPVLTLADAVALPLQPLAFYLVRLPLHGVLSATLGAGALLTTLTLFYAPLTEEPAKWLVLLVPPIRRRLNSENAVALALAVGLGFGIGEIWFLAHQLAGVPAFAALPFYAFGGFLVERLFVCFLHGGMISFAFHRLAQGRSFIVGGLIGIALHFALNFPIYLASIDFLGIGKTAWAYVLTFWVPAMTIPLGAAVTRLSRGRFREVILGFSTCPECGAKYPRSLLALNFGPVRYERCPHCRHFHWVRIGGR